MIASIFFMAAQSHLIISERRPPESLGVYPTPLQRVDALCHDGIEFWIKRDDLTNPIYGGNKVRKLERILENARKSGVKRIVTVGATGSHHVLATAVFAPFYGISAQAVMVPQPMTAHVEANFRAAVELGLQAIRVPGAWLAPLAMMAGALGGATIVAPGGSSVDGALGYVDAARELADQVAAGAMPEPDAIVVALGSGGTAAGLAAGVRLAGLKTKVIGVNVSQPVWLVNRYAKWLEKRCFRAISRDPFRSSLTTDSRYLGRGYGFATDAGDRATAVAAEAGVTLDPTYTAKTFAAALDLAASGTTPVVLYWHTLSSAPLTALGRPVTALLR